MSRIRTIKPEFFRHEGLFEAERASGLPLRQAFAGMWVVADREGRFRWQPRILKLDVLPFDELDFSAVLDALAKNGFVVRYTVGSDVFGFIPSWSKHQHVNVREMASQIPPPPATPPDSINAPEGNVRLPSENMHAPAQDSGEGEGELEGEGREHTKARDATASGEAGRIDAEPSADRRPYSEAFEVLWLTYRPIAPKTATKVDAARAFERLSAADKADCAKGLEAYVAAVLKERGHRPDAPAKHLATFVNKRAWEPFLDTASPPSTGPVDWSSRVEFYKKLGRWPAFWGAIDDVPKEHRGLFPGLFDDRQGATH